MGAFDFIGDLFNRDARNRAANALKDNKSIWQNFDANIDAQQVEDGYGGNSPQAAAYREALNRFGTMGAEGGMDAGSKAALQQAQFSNEQRAKGARDAALERAQAEGRLNSGRALSAQMQAAQGAANANAMAGTQAAGDARQRAMAALATQGQMAGNAVNAGNAINQFNAQMRQGAAQQTVQNQAMRAQGIERGNNAIAGMNNDRAQQARDSAGAIGNAVVGGVTSALTGGLGAMGGGGGGGMGSYGQANPRTTMIDPSTMPQFSEGGVIDGHAKVSGDSTKNDVVPAKLSPGEMVIPRTTVAQGPDAIRAFALKLLRGEG